MSICLFVCVYTVRLYVCLQTERLMGGFFSWHSDAALGLLLVLGREERDKWTERRMKGIYSSSDGGEICTNLPLLEGEGQKERDGSELSSLRRTNSFLFQILTTPRQPQSFLKLPDMVKTTANKQHSSAHWLGDRWNLKKWISGRDN